ncbi:hypothetical protein Ahy_B09g096882 isoform B [Arachis hypogaea]|uniref:NADP-dependent oxidoreductase domain-containing protein n=1 Tax=Arachis hypogaea TaxID=3818 RepID=A0A444XMS5_ARAHY|nr:hypothetical protein Ahy_B09g096882 isoform B [Arachis hypogaea]
MSTFNFVQVAGPSGQMTWIRGGPKCLDGSNIIEAIDNSLLCIQMDYIDLYQIHWPNQYVPMFGETEYGPIHQYPSIGIGEQLKLSEELSKLGRIRYVSLTNETPYGMMKFIQVVKN